MNLQVIAGPAYWLARAEMKRRQILLEQRRERMAHARSFITEPAET